MKLEWLRFYFHSDACVSTSPSADASPTSFNFLPWASFRLSHVASMRRGWMRKTLTRRKLSIEDAANYILLLNPFNWINFNRMYWLRISLRIRIVIRASVWTLLAAKVHLNWAPPGLSNSCWKKYNHPDFDDCWMTWEKWCIRYSNAFHRLNLVSFTLPKENRHYISCIWIQVPEKFKDLFLRWRTTIGLEIILSVK